jgi:hypothetical protein
VAKTHVAFMLERALEDKLMSHRDVVEGVTVEELANRLPKAELGRLIQCALGNANKLTVFSEADLLATTPPRTLVQHVPLSHLWDAVVVPRIAERHGYAAMKDGAAAREVETPKPVPREASALAKDAPAKSAVPKPKEAAPAARAPEPVKEAAPAAKEAAQTAAKDASKAKPKASEQKPAPVDAGPSVAKTNQEYFGGEDDIEIIEEDVKAV